MILSVLLPLPLRAVQVGLVFVGGFGVDWDVCEGGTIITTVGTIAGIIV